MKKSITEYVNEIVREYMAEYEKRRDMNIPQTMNVYAEEEEDDIGIMREFPHP